MNRNIILSSLLVFLSSACGSTISVPETPISSPTIRISTPTALPQTGTPTPTLLAPSPIPTATATPTPTFFNPENFSQFVQVQAYSPAVEKALGRSMLDMRVDAVAYSPDGRYVALGGCTVNGSAHCITDFYESDSFLLLLDAETGGILAALPETDTTVNSLAFSADSQKLIYATSPVRIVVWDIASGAAERTLWKNSNDFSYPQIAVSPDGGMIAAVSGDQLRVWDYPGGTLRTQKPAALFSDALPRFSPDSSRLAVFSREYGKEITIYDTSDWSRVSTVTPPGSQTSIAGFSAVDDTFFTVQDATNADVLLWNVGTGEAAGSMKVPFNHITAIAFPPAGGLMLVAGLSSDSGSFETINIWDLTDSNQIGTIYGWFPPSRILFSSDGSSFLVFAFPFAYRWSLPDEDASSVRRAVLDFLDASAKGDYAAAAALFQPSDEDRAYFDTLGLNSGDLSSVLESLCGVPDRPCEMPLKEILYQGKEDFGGYSLILTFTAPDGSIYQSASGDTTFFMFAEKESDGSMRVTAFPSFFYGG